MKYPCHEETEVIKIYVVNGLVDGHFNTTRSDDSTNTCIFNVLHVKDDSIGEEVMEAMACLGQQHKGSASKGGKFLLIDVASSPKVKPSIKEPPILELKPLPSHLKYVPSNEELTTEKSSIKVSIKLSTKLDNKDIMHL